MIDLRCGDCLEIMKTISDKSIDLILTDPPYGTTACKWDSVIPFDKMWEQLERIIKDNGTIVLFGSEPFSSALRMSNLKHYKYDWYWKKRPVNFLNAKKQPMREIENIMVFFSSGSSYYPQGLIYKPHINKRSNSTETNGKHEKENKADFCKYPKNVIEIINNDKGFHPTQKPVALLVYLIKTYTLEGETVLDFTMGSGSTGVACKNLNRNFIGIELNKKYFDIAKQRIENGFVQEKINDIDLNKFPLFQ